MSEKKEKNSFIMLKEWGEQLQFLDNDQTAELFRMIFLYQSSPENGVPVSDYPIVNSIFLTMRNFFDASEEKYAEICETNRQNGQKGGAPVGNQNARKQPKTTENNRKQPKTTLSESESEYEYDIEYDSKSDIDLNNINNTKEDLKEETVSKDTAKKNAHRSASFCPPTVEDVEKYVSEKGYHVNADAFVDYYKSVNWCVGKNKKMSDWKAAVRTWAHREKGREPPKDTGSWTELAREMEGYL